MKLSEDPTLNIIPLVKHNPVLTHQLNSSSVQ